MANINFSQPYNRKVFLDFLYNQFLPEDFIEQDMNVYIEFNTKYTSKITQLGESPSLDLVVFEVEHNSTHDARVGLAKETYKILDKSFNLRALVIYYPKDNKDNYRFSFLESSFDEKDKNKHINPRRYSYYLGKGIAVHTPNEYLLNKGQIKNEEDLKERFSVEVLTKDFYKELFNWYQWAVDDNSGITFPNNTDIDTDDRDNINIKIIRLITRMLFIWFIKQKHLVPENLFDEDYLKSILIDFKSESKTNGTYYNAILQNLFFATLNQEIDKRSFIKKDYHGKSNSYSIKSLYRDSAKQSWFLFDSKDKEEKVKNIFASIPYLNGGLFDCLDKFELDENGKLRPKTYYDGFSSKDTLSPNDNLKYRAFIPNAFFFADEHEEKINSEARGKVNVSGLINIFKKYNFTVEENAPNDVQVSLDPELLGKVFENLLGCYNPETQETARKESGSFYTPRDIVNYMVNETLINYISTNGKEYIDENLIRPFVTEELTDNIKNPEELIKLLLNVKILDPACGSGAFPMQYLLKITSLIGVLSNDNFDKYQTKLNIIKNCLFGVDIQPIAMLICKLRFFISLICDNERDDSKDNFGITPLPNLETKFVAANTLISASVRGFSSDWLNDSKLSELKNELLALRRNVINIKTHAQKERNLKLDEQKRKEIEEYILENAQKPNETKILRLKKRIKELENDLIKYQGENIVDEWVQPQTSLFEEVEPTLFRHDINKEKREEINKELSKCRSELGRENNKTIPTGFEAAVKQVTLWNPYDQNATTPFFDAEWMFGIKDGFDIVIGNPPYIQLSNNGGLLADMYEEQGYETFARTGDIYCLFYEKGCSLLSHGGYLCFITSNKWMRAGYGEKLRAFLSKKTNPKILIDFAGVKVFESATVDTNILLFSKEKNKENTLACVCKDLTNKDLHNLSKYIKDNASLCAFNTKESWVVLSPIEQSIKQKIESIGTPLKDWDIQINYGIKTGCNEAFIISTEKREEILANCKDEEERKRTEDLIRPILRGRDIKRYSYHWANLWLIATFPSRHYDIEQYPAVKEYLLSFGKERLEQTGKEHIINGERIRARKRTNNQWFETQDSISYWGDFFKPKVVYQELTQGSCFYYDEKAEYFILQTAYFISGNSNLDYLTKLLNSKFIEYCFRKFYSTSMGRSVFRWLSQYVEKLPIALYKDTEIQQQIILCKQTDDKQIDNLIYQMYGLTAEEIEKIEQS